MSHSRCRRVLAVACAAMVGMLAISAAEASQVDDCHQNGDLTRKRDACTALLGALDGVIEGTGWAYAERANAVCWGGDADWAVTDIWHWFDVDPTSIRRMQTKLAQLGYFSEAIDGGFSAELDNAVVAWAEAGCPEAR